MIVFSLTNAANKVKGIFKKDGSFSRLYKHSFNYGFGAVLEQFIGFLLIPLYTRYLLPADYGILELAQTLLAFAVPFMKFGLPGSVSRFYFEYQSDPEKLKDYITTMNRLLNVLALIIGPVLLLLLAFVGEDIFKGLSYWPYMVIAVVTAGLGANNQLQQKIVQNREQSRFAVKLRLIFVLISVMLAIVFVVYLHMGALGLILASLCVTVAFFFQARYYLRADSNGKFRWKMAKEGLGYGSGVVPHHIAAATAPMLNKTILVHFGSLASLGYYSIAMRFFLPLEVLYTAVNTAFFPIYTSYRKNNESGKIRQNVRQILIIGLLAFTVTQLAGPWLMKLVLPQSYWPAIALINILAIAFIAKIIYGICIAEIFYSKKTRFVSIITITGLIMNALVCILFVKGYDYYAISWAFAVNFVICALMTYLYKKKISDFEMFSKEIFMTTVAAILITVLSFGIYA